MKIRTLTNITFGLMFFVPSLIAQANCGARLSPFVDGSPSQRLERIRSLHAQGKKSIAMLVGDIDQPDVAPVTMGGSMYSDERIPSTVYCGVVAAYLVELILGEPFVPAKLDGQDPSLMPPISAGSRSFHSGCIVEKHTGRPVGQGELAKIQAIYQAWWQRNAAKSLDNLRAEWPKGNRPLSESNYGWR